MNVFEVNSIILFILFFIPGFISMKVYNLIIASEKINFSESLVEAIAFSAINYAGLSWLLIIIQNNELYNTNLPLFIILVVIILFIAPILWTLLFIRICKSRRLSNYLLSPIRNPWDYFFDKRQGCWVIVNLKSGKKIGGIYGSKSFASAYPHKEQIYLEKVWIIDDKTENFIKEVPRSNGILILQGEIESLEFFI